MSRYPDDQVDSARDGWGVVALALGINAVLHAAAVWVVSGVLAAEEVIPGRFEWSSAVVLGVGATAWRTRVVGR